MQYITHPDTTATVLQVLDGKYFLECIKQPRPSSAIIFYLRSRSSRRIGLDYPDNLELANKSRRQGLIWDGSCWSGKEFSVNRLIDSVTKNYPQVPKIKAVRQFEDVQAVFVNLGKLILFKSGSLQREYAQLLLNSCDINWLVLAETANDVAEVTAIMPHKTAKRLRAELKARGARISNSLSDYIACPVNVSVTGWVLHLKFSSVDVRHLAFAAPQVSQDNPPILGPWNWTLTTTRTMWNEIRRALDKAEIPWCGDNPDQLAVRSPIKFDARKIGGWDDRTVAGQSLHQYQREGIQFAASRGMRAIIADEMGTGKTIQAISCARGIGASRIVVVCPANARYVWDAEIKSWRKPGDRAPIIWHSGIGAFSPEAQWVIATYDQLTVRTKFLEIDDDDEAILRHNRSDGFELSYHKLAHPDQEKTVRIVLSILTPQMPASNLYISLSLRKAWHQAVREMEKRLKFIQTIKAWKPEILIVDEAHKVKNEQAKRTHAVRQFALITPYVLALSGTPIRNHAGEPAVIMSIIDPDSTAALNQLTADCSYYSQKYENAVSECLGWYMIRRQKKDVLHELPEKIRQWIPLRPAKSFVLKIVAEYKLALSHVIEGEGIGLSQVNAVERAAAVLAQIKIADGQIADAIKNIVNEKGCCVVFGCHIDALDRLNQQLRERGMRVARVDGRTSTLNRSVAVKDFQQGAADIFLATIRAGGEAITLTRADTCVIYELPWVPAEILQAEDRCHRVGQKASRYHIIHFHAAGYEIDEILVRLHATKLGRINRVLGEDTNIFFGATNDPAVSLIREVAEELRSNSKRVPQYIP